MNIAGRIDALLAAGGAPRLHGLVVVRDGRVELERYGAGEDFRLNVPLGHVTFGPDVIHDVRSVTKSVVALLYGAALGDGLVPAPGEPLLPAFPAYADLAEGKEHLTVEHALTMTLGLDWNEDVPYTSTANSELAMEAAPDRYRYILERPLVEEPGKRWRYCGGAAALLGRLIADGAGVPLEEFARERLFGPLGMPFEWTANRGVAMAAAGLRLRPRDLAELGSLVLDGGRGLVPGPWIAEMLRPRVRIAEGFEYGYQWYVSPGQWVTAIGNGGQRVLVAPERRLVVAVAAGDYDSDQTSAEAVMREVLADE
ncbi:serine hydrolase domain-containing protein [Nonomuraea roseoviolacea]|uniref:CubicO group peptidase (Beta-lactamase class C family) n=1 Tax=Nonomuraea roseoviolacea subsp. carminata TaxID=160689 RepID=A0ABT1K1E7_9ACTN|nr:serine hydrolase domain-containing protein [Nonomuraea roseoviolacea]MCP2347469.1 CubicO group peptidase (beta-lactamase class C family) [Nonomuraea roseoviolacea subsp. carminata]